MNPTTTNPPVLIDNSCSGFGDAIVYSWALHSANEHVERLRIFPRQTRWVFDLLDAGRWCEKDEPTFPWVCGDHPAKGIIGVKGWLRNWLDCWGFEDAKFVRPTHNLTEEEIVDAHRWWDERKINGLRTLIFPDGIWKPRVWEENRSVRLAWLLHEHGANVMAMLTHYRNHMFPFAVGGAEPRRMAAMIATADIVVGCESGPVHLAATLGTKAFCIYGGTRPELMHEQYGDLVVPIQTTKERVPCVGCNFEFDRGCRAWCDAGCFAMYDVTPFQVFEVICGREGLAKVARPGDVPVTLTTPARKQAETPVLQAPRADLAGRAFNLINLVAKMAVAKRSPCRPVPRPEFARQDTDIIDDVFDRDCYRVYDMQNVTRAIDIGGCFGAFACKLAEKFPGAGVSIVEPVPENQTRILETIASKLGTGARLVRGAAFYGAETVRLHTTVFDGSNNTGGSSVALDGKLYVDEYRDGGEVATVTIEQIMAERGWDIVDVVKMDCEGAEFNILENCDITRVKVFVGEWHDEQRFHALVERRFSGWKFEVLRSGQIGLFRLTNPGVV